MEQRNIDAYVPDSNLASELNLGTRCRVKARAPAHRRMRAKLRSPDGQAAYARRKAVVEPVFGVLKQQRGMSQFRTRGLQNVNNEFTLATLAYNITRLHVADGSLKPNPADEAGETQPTTPLQKGQRRSHADTKAPLILRNVRRD